MPCWPPVIKREGLMPSPLSRCGRRAQRSAAMVSEGFTAAEVGSTEASQM
jgi:hypothetical protein